MNKKWCIIAAATALIAGLGIVGYQRIAAQRATDEESVETAVVRRGTLLVTADATGSLAPQAEVSLSFSSGGRVGELFVEEGQVVEAGQPLARLETDDLELQVAQAEATLAAAEVQLAQLLAPPQPEEIAVYEANLQAMQAQVSAAAANRDQVTAGPDATQIADAEAQLASARAQYKSALDTHDRTMTCITFTLPKNFTLPDGTKPDDTEVTICPALGPPEEQARYNLQSAEAALAAAQAQLNELLDGADADEIRAAQADVLTVAAERDATQAELDLLLAGPTEEQVQTTQAAVDEARAALDQARLRLEKGTLMAPMAGTVTLLDIRPGEIINANQPVIVLGDLAALEIEVNLDETDVSRVAVGQEVQVSLDAFPGVEMTGEVTYIAPVAQTETGVVLYPVTVRLTPTDPSAGPSVSSGQDSGQGLPVRTGMTADVSIVTVSQEDTLIIPLRAVKTEGEHAYVDRLTDGQIERVEVELGLITDTEIEITSGLAEGDVVVVVE